MWRRRATITAAAAVAAAATLAATADAVAVADAPLTLAAAALALAAAALALAAAALALTAADMRAFNCGVEGLLPGCCKPGLGDQEYGRLVSFRERLLEANDCSLHSSAKCQLQVQG